MLKLKPGVRLGGMRPELVPALIAAAEVFPDFIVTSVTDGVHGERSFHYSGLAFDARTRDLSAGEAEAITERLRDALSACYDVVLESDHLHVEYDPKPRPEEPPAKLT